MRQTLLLVALLLLITGSAFAQAAIGGPVGPQVADPANVPPILAIDDQGTVVVGDPATGDYSVLVNGWIEAYARVSAYDNWIDFGVMSPTSGSYAAPVRRYAFSTTGAGYGLAGETGGRDPIYAVNGSTMNFDLAGLQIQTNARLDLVMDFGGYLTACSPGGVTYTGADKVDTRRLDGYQYQLRNQMKMVLHGKFLEGNPGQLADGTAYTSVTSGQATDYNDWTNWGAAANAIDNEDGWFEPSITNDPWTGDAAFATDGGRPQLPSLNLVVERGQAQTTGTGEAAEIWFTQSILRRGLQDAAGNYRADMMLTLTYREADAQWLPGVKP